MYKDKKINCKKTYVRNTELNKPRTVIINEQDIRGELSEKQSNKDGDTKKPNGKQAEQVGVNLDTPNINSSLMIAKKMKDIENIRPQKTGKALKSQDKKFLVDELVTKKVNFPYDQPIYKDLIPLCTKTQHQPQQPVSTSSSRASFVSRDKEPSLSEFYKPKIFSEHSYVVSVQNNPKTIMRGSDPLRLCTIMQNWEC